MSERSPLLTTASSSDTLSDGGDNSNGNVNPVDHDENGAKGGVSLLRGCITAAAMFALISTLTFGVSILTTIQSPIAKELDVTTGVSWFVSAYLISSTSILPIAGKLCQIFSPKSYLLVSTVIQTIGLLLTAFAPSFAVFTLGRVICGIGASAATPVAFILVTNLAPRKRWGTLFGLLNMGYTIGLALGAAVGGALEPIIGWRALFWIQAPISLGAGTVAYFAIPSHPSQTKHGRPGDLTMLQKLAKLDYFGMITLISAVVLLLYSLASPQVQIVPVILSLASFGLFCLVEARWAAEPIVPLAVMGSRSMLFTGLASLGLMSARWQSLFYIPTYAIAVRGWAPAKAGLLSVPTNAGFGTGSVIVGLLHIKRPGSFYLPCIICFLVFIIDQFVLSRLMTPDSPMWLFILTIFANGFAAGALLNYNLTHLLHLIVPAHHVIAIPLNALYRSLSGSIGSAFSGGLFARSLRKQLSDGFESRGLYGKETLISQLLSRPLLVQKLEGADLEVAITGYANSLEYLFGAGTLLVVFMLCFQAGTGWTAPKQQEQEQPEAASGLTSDARENHQGSEPLVK